MTDQIKRIFSQRPKTRNRLILYVIGGVCSFIPPAVSVAMFGDGTLAWPDFVLAWVLFGVGLLGNVVNNIRAFIDQTPAEEEQNL